MPKSRQNITQTHLQPYAASSKRIPQKTQTMNGPASLGVSWSCPASLTSCPPSDTQRSSADEWTRHGEWETKADSRGQTLTQRRGQTDGQRGRLTQTAHVRGPSVSLRVAADVPHTHTHTSPSPSFLLVWDALEHGELSFLGATLDARETPQSPLAVR